MAINTTKGVDANVSSKLHSLLAEIFSSWPNNLPVLGSHKSEIQESDVFARVQVVQADMIDWSLVFCFLLLYLSFRHLLAHASVFTVITKTRRVS